MRKQKQSRRVNDPLYPRKHCKTITPSELLRVGEDAASETRYSVHGWYKLAPLYPWRCSWAVSYWECHRLAISLPLKMNAYLGKIRLPQDTALRSGLFSPHSIKSHPKFPDNTSAQLCQKRTSRERGGTTGLVCCIRGSRHEGDDAASMWKGWSSWGVLQFCIRY